MSVLISVPIARAISQYSNLNHACGLICTKYVVLQNEALTNKPCEIQTKFLTVNDDSFSLLAGIIGQLIMCVHDMDAIREEKDACQIFHDSSEQGSNLPLN